MKKSKKQKCAFDLLPFHVIEAASTGDTEAIQAVLKHYEGYITVLATRKMFDEFGQVHYCVDETLRQRLEAKLITKTLGFDTKSYVSPRRKPMIKKMIVPVEPTAASAFVPTNFPTTTASTIL